MKGMEQESKNENGKGRKSEENIREGVEREGKDEGRKWKRIEEDTWERKGIHTSQHCVINTLWPHKFYAGWLNTSASLDKILKSCQDLLALPTHLFLLAPYLSCSTRLSV